MANKVILSLLCILIILSFSQVYAKGNTTTNTKVKNTTVNTTSKNTTTNTKGKNTTTTNTTNSNGKEPSANASAKKIMAYIDSNDITKTSLNKLIAWYSKIPVTNTYYLVKIDQALRAKTASEVEAYVSKNKDNLKSLPKAVSNILLEKAEDSGDIETSSKIKNAQSAAAAVKDPTESPEYYDPTGGITGESKVKEIAGIIIAVIRNIGIIISVIILMIIGIRYMLGSVEEKAEYKSTLLPYLIGAIILFSGATIPQIIYSLIT